MHKDGELPGGWEVFTPRSGTGRFEKYNTQMVVIVSIGKNSKGNKLYLSDKTYQSLGKPEWVRIAWRGTSVGIVPVEKRDPHCYRVAVSSDAEGKPSGMHFINAQAFIREYHIKEGAFDAHSENGVLVFDTKSTPSIV